MKNIISYLLSRKGQIVTVKARRLVKTKKSFVGSIEKESIFQAAVGVSYDNKASVQSKRESGELPSENAGLPWGRWELFPYIIEHKGKRYFRFSTVKNNFVPKTRFFLNGKEVSRDEIREHCLASEFSSKEKGDCFNFPLETVLEAK